jgi:hypothetical protein
LVKNPEFLKVKVMNEGKMYIEKPWDMGCPLPPCEHSSGGTRETPPRPSAPKNLENADFGLFWTWGNSREKNLKKITLERRTTNIAKRDSGAQNKGRRERVPWVNANIDNNFVLVELHWRGHSMARGPCPLVLV